MVVQVCCLQRALQDVRTCVNRRISCQMIPPQSVEGPRQQACVVTRLRITLGGPTWMASLIPRNREIETDTAKFRGSRSSLPTLANAVECLMRFPTCLQRFTVIFPKAHTTASLSSCHLPFLKSKTKKFRLSSSTPQLDSSNLQTFLIAGNAEDWRRPHDQETKPSESVGYSALKGPVHDMVLRFCGIRVLHVISVPGRLQRPKLLRPS